MRFQVRFSESAKRALAEQLPEKVAAAAFEFIVGALADNPRRVGKQLAAPLYPLYSARRGEYRIIYEVLDAEVSVFIVAVTHRRDAYRREPQ